MKLSCGGWGSTYRRPLADIDIVLDDLLLVRIQAGGVVCGKNDHPRISGKVSQIHSP